MNKILHKQYILILLFFICQINGYSIPNIKVTGNIIDQNNAAIAFAHIHLSESNLGCVSNMNGAFSFQIPFQEKFTLIISAIGYKTKIVDFKKSTSKNNITIKLETNTINLNEISIKVKATNANEIVIKAFDNYHKNFPSESFIGKAFLRHTEKNKKQYKWLVDAAISVYDPGFNSDPKNIDLNVMQIRQSLDNRKIDTTNIFGFYLKNEKGISFKESTRRKLKLSSEDPLEIKKAITYEDNRKSKPIALFSSGLNVIRYFNQKDAVFDNKIEKKHNFKIDSVLYYNNEEIYKIKI